MLVTCKIKRDRFPTAGLFSCKAGYAVLLLLLPSVVLVSVLIGLSQVAPQAMAVYCEVGNQPDAVLQGKPATEQELHLILAVVLCGMIVSPKLTIRWQFPAIGLLYPLYRFCTELLQRCQPPFVL